MPTGRGRRARRRSHSTPGRIAAETMKPRKSSAITTLIFQRASASTTIEPETSVTTAARLAVAVISRVSSLFVEAFNPVLSNPEERVCVDSRRHGVVLVKPLSRALALAVLGVTSFVLEVLLNRPPT